MMPAIQNCVFLVTLLSNNRKGVLTNGSKKTWVSSFYIQRGKEVLS